MNHVLNYESPDEQPGVAGRAKRALSQGGPWRLVKGGAEYSWWAVKKGTGDLWAIGYGRTKYYLPTIKQFTFDGATYTYLNHPYSRTWNNERTVEVPIGEKIVDDFAGKRILEFGNVLGHYRSFEHDVLDKYETSGGVINKDIVGFNADKPYDLIIGLSTLEHVGWDEDERDPGKLQQAVDSLIGALAPGGTLFLSIPVGYNPFLDHLVESGQITFDKMLCMERTSRWNDWQEVPYEAIKHRSYGDPYNGANGVIFGWLTKK